MRRTSVLLATFCCVIISSLESRAQYGVEDGIQGSGQITLERSAERMRMQVSLLAKSSKDLSDALAKLKSQRAKVEKQLQTLGAIKDSVKFGDPHVDAGQDDSQRQMQMMMRQRMAQRGGKKKADKEQAIKIVKVSMKLTAEWPLKATDPAGLLLEGNKLQEAIKAADLGASKEAEEPTPEEAEMADEMEEAQMNFGGQQGPKPGEPEFIFVAKITDADRDKARVDAFKAAKAEAIQLAKAADMQLGDLVRLGKGYSSGGMGDYDDSDEVQHYYNRGMGQMLRHYASGKEEASEAVGISPGTLKFRVGVTASFAIKPAVAASAK